MPLSCVTPAFNNTLYLVLKLPEADDLFGSSHGAVVDDGRLLSTATLHMVIHSIVAHVQLPSNKPSRDSVVQTSNMKKTPLFFNLA